MRHRLHKMAWVAWLTVVILTVVFALFVTSLRVVTPMLQNYGEQINTYLTHAMEHPVRLGEIKSQWYGFGPVIEINDIAIYDQDQKNVILSAKYARLRFSLFALLRQMSLVPASLSIEQGVVTLQYSESKRWSVLGVGSDAPEEPQDPARLWDWIASEQRVKLEDFTVLIKAYNGQQLHFDHLNALLSDDGSHVDLQLTAQWREMDNEKITVMGDFDSRSLSNQQLEGRLYTHVPKIDWKPLSVFLPSSPAAKVQQGTGSMELWLDWLSGKLFKIQTEVQLQNIGMELEGAVAPVLIDKLAGTFVWLMPGEDQWVFWADNATIAMNKIVAPGMGFRWSHHLTDKQENTFEAETINLGTVATLMQGLPTWSPYQAQFMELKPSGQLKSFHLELEKNIPEITPHFSLQTTFSELNLTGLPGVKNVSGVTGTLEMTDLKGVLKLNSQDLHVDLSPLFTQTWNFSQINSTFEWQKEKKGWRILANELNIMTEQKEQAVVRGMLWLPDDKEQSPEVELLATIPSIELNDALRFVPEKKLSPKFSEWLDQAFVKGRLEKATLVIRGPWNSFPFDQGDGKFEIHALLKDTTLSYHPLWPPVEDIDAELLFSGHRMDATILSGKLTGANIQKSIITIPYIGPEHPMVIQVPGKLIGSADAGMKFLRDSPLWDKLGADLGTLKFNGPIKVDLDMVFPLGQPTVPPTVYGSIALEQAQVLVPTLDLAFNKVVGTLGFSDKAVTAHNLHAELYGKPVELDVDTVSQPNKYPDYLQFRIEGRGDPSMLLKRYPDPLWKHAKGEFQYAGVLEIRHAPDPQSSWFLLSSDLHGVTFDLPSPFGKVAKERRDFSYKTTIGQPGRTSVEIKYGEKLAGRIEFGLAGNKTTLRKGTVVLNSGQIPALSGEPGLRINGKLDTISLDDWIPFVTDYLQARAKTAGPASTVDAQVYAKVDTSMLIFAKRAFAVNTVEAYGGKAEWKFMLQGKDMSGNVILPADLTTQRLGLNFDYLFWCNVLEGPSGKEESAKISLKQNDLPPLQVKIDNWYVDNKLIGQIDLVTTKSQNSTQINDLRVTSPEYSIAAQGEWVGHDASQYTTLKGKFKTADLGKTLESWGLNPDLKNARTTVNFNLRWPGEPMAWELKKLSGEMDLKIKDGRIKEINPGGIGRILSLVNVDSLQRRLRLNFSDVLKEGFTFDELVGHVRLNKGIASTDDTMISSSSTKISVKGSTSLVRKTLDLRIIIMPHVTGALPIAAAIAVNPLAGAAVWAADKILSPQLQQLTQYWYSVTGTWTAPKVEPIDRGSPSRRRNKE